MSEPNPFLSSGSSAPAASGSGGEARALAAGQGWAWITGGFDLFKKNPGIWIAIIVLLFVITIVLSIIPFLGSIALLLLMPVFFGGIMLGCRALAGGEPLEIGHLFAGFKSQAGSLVVIGAITLGLTIVVMLPVMAIVGFGAFFGASAGGTAGAGGVGASFLLAFLIAFGLSVLIYMAIWFAPALVVFRGMAPVAAMKASFGACLKNIVPFIIYGVVVLVLGIVAAIPFMLGWLVLGPVLAASVFVAYRDIFGDA